MSPHTTCCFAHEHAMATMIYDDHVGFVSLSLNAFTRTNEDDEHIATFPAFPGRIGIGDTRDEALDSLRCVLEEWVALFLEHNTIELFQDYLTERSGFHLVPRPFRPAASESEGAEHALLNVRIPGVEDPSNAVQ